eukprot:1154890-Pelagomonas_calceolata.AAC.4
MNKIWPAWPPEHSSREREQKTHAEGTQLKTLEARKHARNLAEFKLDCFKARHKDRDTLTYAASPRTQAFPQLHPGATLTQDAS